MPAVISPVQLPPDLSQAFTGLRTTNLFDVPDNSDNMVIAWYCEGTGAVATFTPTGAASATMVEEEGRDGGNTYGMGVGYVPANSGAGTITWPGTCTSGVIVGLNIGDAAVLEYGSPIYVDTSSISGDQFPAVTPTGAGQIVLCVTGFGDNTGTPNQESDFNAATVGNAIYRGSFGATTFDGGDSATYFHAWEMTDTEVGVPFAPSLGAIATDPGTLASILVDSVEQTNARVILKSGPTFASTPVTPTTAAWPGFPTAAEINAVAQPQDVFFLIQSGYSGRTIDVSNAAWLDDEYGGTDLPFAAYLGWKRLDEGLFDAAWESSPPEYTFNVSSGNSYFWWGLVRGLQRTGVYVGDFPGQTFTGPSFINYWNDVPGSADSDESVFMVVAVAADSSNTAWPTQPAWQQFNSARVGACFVPHDEWTPGDPGTEVDFDWSFNRTPTGMSVSFLEAAPTWFIPEQDVSADVTVTCTMTAEPGAKFIVTDDIVADVTITDGLFSQFPRRPAARREFVYIRGLDGELKGVLA